MVGRNGEEECLRVGRWVGLSVTAGGEAWVSFGWGMSFIVTILLFLRMPWLRSVMLSPCLLVAKVSRPAATAGGLDCHSLLCVRVSLGLCIIPLQ